LVCQGQEKQRFRPIPTVLSSEMTSMAGQKTACLTF